MDRWSEWQYAIPKASIPFIGAQVMSFMVTCVPRKVCLCHATVKRKGLAQVADSESCGLSAPHIRAGHVPHGV